MNFLIIEANHDSATKAVHIARRTALRNLSNGNGNAIIELFGYNATESNVDQSWHEIFGNFRLITGMGHGSASEFTGHNDLPIFTTTKSKNVYKDAIVHLFSCNCGNSLGFSIKANGAKAFIGYTDFVGIASIDALNEHFVAEAAAIDIAIYQGQPSGVVKSRADTAYAQARANLEASPNATPSDLATLESNHAALVGPWNNGSLGSF
jgi:hypothetical protein